MESREKKKNYYWTVRGERVEVTEEVYLGILSENERVRRLARNEQRCARTDSLYCLGDCSECRYRMAGMLRELSEFGFWYAEYGDAPRTVFDFDMWQYSETGEVAGIEGNVDLNIYFVR